MTEEEKERYLQDSKVGRILREIKEFSDRINDECINSLIPIRVFPHYYKTLERQMDRYLCLLDRNDVEERLKIIKERLDLLFKDKHQNCLDGQLF